jgi:hypothetical protein
VDADSEDKVFKEASVPPTRWARDPDFNREDDLFAGSVTLLFRVCGGGGMCRLMLLGREAVATRADDRTTLRLFSSGALFSAELFKDNSGSSTVSLASGLFTMALGLRRVPLGSIVANGLGSAISSGPLSSEFFILFGFVRGYERFFPMTETGIDSDAESGSEDVRVRRDEPSSAVVSVVDSRLGTADDPEAKEARRLGRSWDLIDPKGWRGVRRVILNPSSSSSVDMLSSASSVVVAWWARW